MFPVVETLKRLGMAMRAMSGVQMSSTLRLAEPNGMILLRCPRIEVWLTPTLEAKIRGFFELRGSAKKNQGRLSFNHFNNQHLKGLALGCFKISGDELQENDALQSPGETVTRSWCQ